MTKIEMHRGDVVLIAFPFIVEGSVQRKRRPALVVQADRYNRRREAVIIAAITSSKAHRELPCKVFVARNSAAGRKGDSNSTVSSTARPWPPFLATRSWNGSEIFQPKPCNRSAARWAMRFN